MSSSAHLTLLGPLQMPVGQDLNIIRVTVTRTATGRADSEIIAETGTLRAIDGIV